MATKTFLATLAVVILCAAACVQASPKKHDGNVVSTKSLLDVEPTGLLSKRGHTVWKRFLGLHLHRRPKVVLVNPAIPQQIVYIKKHRHSIHPAVVSLGAAAAAPLIYHHYHHRHRHHGGVKLHIGLGRR